MSRGKPYLAGKQEYLEYRRRPDWIDDQNPNDQAEYSEFQKPYALGDREEDGYPAWEWSWPPILYPGLDPITNPDPVGGHPCSMDGSCTWAKILGSNLMECDECASFTQIHVWLGCTFPPSYAAFGGWTLSGGDGECWLEEGLVISRVCCSEDASPQKLTLCYESGECKDCIEITVDCDECCEDFSISGSATVNPSSTWTGTISPACPGASCEVTSDCGPSACSVNGAGSQVTVVVGASDCGGFTVTVTEPEGCEDKSDSISVRINNTGQGGSWSNLGFCSGVAGFSTGQTEDFNAGCLANDQQLGYIQYDETRRVAWNSSSTSNWYNHCREWNEGSGDSCINPGSASCPGPGDQSCATAIDTAYYVWEWNCSC